MDKLSGEICTFQALEDAIDDAATWSVDELQIPVSLVPDFLKLLKERVKYGCPEIDHLCICTTLPFKPELILGENYDTGDFEDADEQNIAVCFSVLSGVLKVHYYTNDTILPQFLSLLRKYVTTVRVSRALLNHKNLDLSTVTTLHLGEDDLVGYDGEMKFESMEKLLRKILPVCPNIDRITGSCSAGITLSSSFSQIKLWEVAAERTGKFKPEELIAMFPNLIYMEIPAIKPVSRLEELWFDVDTTDTKLLSLFTSALLERTRSILAKRKLDAFIEEHPLIMFGLV